MKYSSSCIVLCDCEMWRLKQMDVRKLQAVDMNFCKMHKNIHRRRRRTYQHTAFTVLDRYGILYAGHKSEASVGSGRRHRIFNWYGFRFSTTLWNVFVTELRDSIVFPVVQTVLWTFDLYCACGSAHTYSHLDCMKPSCILPHPRLSFARFGWV